VAEDQSFSDHVQPTPIPKGKGGEAKLDVTNEKE
jgi:hypothetical protein